MATSCSITAARYLPIRFAQPRWVKVGAGNGTPTILSQNTSGDSGGATAVSRVSLGQYLVRFTSEITGCGWVATVNDTDAGSVASRMIGVERNSSASDLDLRVRTFGPDGLLADLDSDDAFTLQVLC